MWMPVDLRLAPAGSQGAEDQGASPQGGVPLEPELREGRRPHGARRVRRVQPHLYHLRRVRPRPPAAAAVGRHRQRPDKAVQAAQPAGGQGEGVVRADHAARRAVASPPAGDQQLVPDHRAEAVRAEGRHRLAQAPGRAGQHGGRRGAGPAVRERDRVRGAAAADGGRGAAGGSERGARRDVRDAAGEAQGGGAVQAARLVAGPGAAGRRAGAGVEGRGGPDHGVAGADGARHGAVAGGAEHGPDAAVRRRGAGVRAADAPVGGQGEGRGGARRGARRAQLRLLVRGAAARLRPPPLNPSIEPFNHSTRGKLLPKDSTFGFSPSSFFLFLFLASFVNALIERVDFFCFLFGREGVGRSG
ncbi:hypothetical protein OsJ_04056 [Oryza sativa Japonica Group]|uniref:Uncharacterized protein n=1 Tax=Oryza sativa subsp. japonica TaxID=39947 RepID=B9EUD8_ORYSJ|nr:hypothetical protein OsJ_04056 [Oryza sativa Japonica Group]